MANDAGESSSMTWWRDPTRWRLENIEVRYDSRADILYMRALPVEPAGGLYLDAEQEIMGLIADDGELIGAQIDNFRVGFLKRHPQHERYFQDLVRPRLLSRRLRTISPTPEMMKDMAQAMGPLTAMRSPSH